MPDQATSLDFLFDICAAVHVEVGDKGYLIITLTPNPDQARRSCLGIGATGRSPLRW